MKIAFRITSIGVTLCILLSLLVVAPLSAFETAAPEPDLLWSYETMYNVTDIATGDLNGDGKDDVVAIDYEPTTLSAISGDDGSTLWDDATIAGFAVEIGDITGDGKNEVIAAGRKQLVFPGVDSGFGGSTEYMINAYTANGTPLWSYSTHAMVHDIEIGDVDGDSIDDVIACNDNSATMIYVLRGNNTTPEGWPISSPSNVADLAVGQLDGEAGVDVAAIGEDHSLYVYDSSGDLLWDDTNVSGRTVEIGDVDGDGDNEIVAPFYGALAAPKGSFGETSMHSWVLAFDGDEGGEPLYSFYINEEEQRITDIELGDLDGDPGVEVAAITTNDNTLYAIDIDSETEQKLWSYCTSWPSMYYGESLAIGDVDRDYKNEVIAAQSGDPHCLYAFDGLDDDGDGIGDHVWNPYYVDYAITDVALGDLDGDGDQDVAFGTESPRTVYAITKVEEPFISATGTGTVYIDSDPSVIGNPTAVDPATLPDEGKPEISFPHGLFSFNITGLEEGQTATVTFTLPDPLPMTAEYWKYGPTQGDPTDHWYQLPMGDNDGDNVITIELTDGGLGDDDLTANGTIVDDGGPGYYIPVGGEAYPVEKSGLTLLWLSVAFAVVWIVFDLLMLRQKRRNK